MDLEDWRCFMAAARNKSMTLAARELYLAQPTVSKRIKKLEMTLGVALFARVGRSVQLTPAGQVLFAEGLDMVPKEERLLARLKEAAAEKEDGRLFAALLGTAGPRAVSALNELKSAYPAAEIEADVVSQRQALQLLEEGIADVIVALEFGMPLLRRIETKWLYTVGISLVLPENHWFLEEKQKDFTVLQHEPFLVFSPKETPESTRQAKEILASWGIPSDRCREVRSLETALLLITAGQGLAILPDDAIRYTPGNVCFYPIPGKREAVRMMAAWKRDNVNPLVPVFVNLMKGR